jgi:S1 RNA binding domain protein
MEETNNSMELTVGAVLEGKVKSITNFGAFVALPENKTGMVHISEIANAYVSDIRQHLTEGQDVKVMVINLDNGKVNLSIKRLEPKPQAAGRPNFRREGGEGRPERPDRGNFRRESNNQQQRPAPVRAAAPVPPPVPKTKDQQFEDMMKAFMSESDSKLSGMRADHRTKSRRR